MTLVIVYHRNVTQSWLMKYREVYLGVSEKDLLPDKKFYEKKLLFFPVSGQSFGISLCNTHLAAVWEKA